MAFTPTKTPKVVKKMFPNYIWDIQTNEKEIYLTFDDGPTPKITNWTIETLKNFDAKATFFCIGKNIKNHPEIFQNILMNGHAIGNHTYNHMKGWQTSAKDYLDNIEETQKLIDTFKVDNNQSIKKNFRPPYGQITPKQGKALISIGYEIIMWNVLSYDWSKTVTPQQCLNRVKNKISKGSIVVFHDSLKASKNMTYVLPKILQHFSSMGYKFKALDT